ncbi:MFS transporter [Pyxidicoccus xibeiensis]|uniref:MFS transporter n=1 Tax=Pyxidicoccus xibeiensis TaxID=2906759 RepID=UPI0020A76D37|nr:MFS transporter [Pyxidicoccus xibeiensis]MCP3140007.1 MFS transporter [Pyxidicoccus xibeiensis]
MDSAPAAGVGPSPASSLFEYRDFRLYQVARFVLTLGTQMQSVAVAWHVYSLTQRPLDLGLVGLAQFLPALLLSLVTGYTADRFDRRKVLLCCYATLGLGAALLWALDASGSRSVWPLYGVLVLLGTARAFSGPAAQSLVTHLVHPSHLARAVAWNSTTFEVATIAGPAVGGVLYGVIHARGVYALCLGLFVTATLMLARMHVRTGRMDREDGSWERLVAGLRFVWNRKVVLGAISLDLFAVLLGGAVALMPIYAREVLHTGSWGLGLLRSAPAVGAAVTAVALAHFPLQRRTGVVMLACVALFGVATVVFGLSTNLFVSMVALAVLGAADMVSVVTRMTLVQLATPPEMRGRVSAVNMVFIGASNELGEFESGLTAEWFGAVPAVILGGLGTLAVVALWAWRFPELRRIDRVDEVRASGA